MTNTKATKGFSGVADYAVDCASESNDWYEVKPVLDCVTDSISLIDDYELNEIKKTAEYWLYRHKADKNDAWDALRECWHGLMKEAEYALYDREVANAC